MQSEYEIPLTCVYSCGVLGSAKGLDGVVEDEDVRDKTRHA